VIVPEGLNTHAHSLQIQPWKFCLSSHTNLRRIAAIRHTSRFWCGYASLKDGAALVFDVAAAAKTAPFVALSEVLPKSPLFERTSEPS